MFAQLREAFLEKLSFLGGDLDLVRLERLPELADEFEPVSLVQLTNSVTKRLIYHGASVQTAERARHGAAYAGESAPRRDRSPGSSARGRGRSEDAMAEVNRYLLVFDHHAGRLVQDPVVFRGDAEAAAALNAYDAAEEVYADRRERFEVLLVGAESGSTRFRATQGRFFRDRDTAESAASA